MLQAERFPPLNPLRFTKMSEVLPAKYNTYGFDNGMFWQQVRTFYQKEVNYAIKVSDGSNLPFYIDSLAGAISVSVYNDLGEKVGGPVAYVYLHNVAGNVDRTFSQLFNCFFQKYDLAAAGLANGYYYIVIECLYNAPGDPANTWYMSECWKYRAAGHKKTMLIEYTNSINNYDVMFETFRTVPSPTVLGLHEINLNFRAEMVIEDPDPASHDTVFEDQLYVINSLDSVPYRVFKLIVGGKDGVPAYVIDKVNRILSCDRIAIDGVFYVKDDNAKWSVNNAPGYRLKVGSIQLREADPNAGWEYTTPSPDFSFRIHEDVYANTHN